MGPVGLQINEVGMCDGRENLDYLMCITVGGEDCRKVLGVDRFYSCNLQNKDLGTEGWASVRAPSDAQVRLGFRDNVYVISVDIIPLNSRVVLFIGKVRRGYYGNHTCQAFVLLGAREYPKWALGL